MQKSPDSKNPTALEFPGGKIDEIENMESTLEEQQKAAVDEIQQETGIEISQLPMEKIEDFEIYFEASDKDGVKKKYKRRVHLFLIRLPEEQEIVPKVNETLNIHGESEDNHKGYTWLTPDELVASATHLEENPDTDEKSYPLSRNSRHIKALLKAIEY